MFYVWCRITDDGNCACLLDRRVATTTRSPERVWGSVTDPRDQHVTRTSLRFECLEGCGQAVQRVIPGTVALTHPRDQRVSMTSWPEACRSLVVNVVGVCGSNSRIRRQQSSRHSSNTSLWCILGRVIASGPARAHLFTYVHSSISDGFMCGITSAA